MRVHPNADSHFAAAKSLFIVAMSVAALVACDGGVSSLSPHGPASVSDALAPAAAKITLAPPTLSVAPGATAKVVISEKGYTGLFTGTSGGKTACRHIASWSPAKGK